MATLTIRNLPDNTYDQLRIRAAENKRSMEAEARAILAEAVAPKDAAAQRASFADEPKVWRGEVAPKPQEEKARQALESLRKMMKTVKAADGGSVVDEFLAERRKDVGREVIVLDSSAFLTTVKNEPGAEAVEAALADAAISTVNVAEILGKVAHWKLDVAQYLTLFGNLSVELVEFDLDQAVIAGQLLTVTSALGLSLGDRACLALAMKRGCPVMTADRAWSSLNIGVPIQLIR